MRLTVAVNKAVCRALLSDFSSGSNSFYFWGLHTRYYLCGPAFPPFITGSMRRHILGLLCGGNERSPVKVPVRCLPMSTWPSARAASLSAEVQGATEKEKVSALCMCAWSLPGSMWQPTWTLELLGAQTVPPFWQYFSIIEVREKYQQNSLTPWTRVNSSDLLTSTSQYSATCLSAIIEHGHGANICQTVSPRRPPGKHLKRRDVGRPAFRLSKQVNSRQTFSLSLLSRPGLLLLEPRQQVWVIAMN